MQRDFPKNGLFPCLLVLLVAGCATQVPPAIREAPVDAVAIDEVLTSPDQYLEREVRWGGVVLEVDNHPDETRVTLLALSLSASGEPRDESASPGRFIAVIRGFLDPVVYARDRQLTVRGRLSGFEERKVGEFVYGYPVVVASDYYLWPEAPEYEDNDYPYWWYDPWYYPWYPYHPHRYQHH